MKDERNLPRPVCCSIRAVEMASRMVLAVWPLCTIVAAAATQAAPVNIQLNVTAESREIKSGWTSVYYPDAASNAPALLIGNDGMTATGGFRVLNLDSSSPISEVTSIVTGRTKLITTVYGLGGGGKGKAAAGDVIITIAQTDAIIRVFDAVSFVQIPTLTSPTVTLGDWNAICPWQSSSGNHYFFLFGKGGRAFQYLVRKVNDAVEILEVRSIPVSASFVGCAVSQKHSTLFLTEEVDQDVYTMELVENTAAPAIVKVANVTGATGVSIYETSCADKDYIFVAREDSISVYYHPWEIVGKVTLTGRKKMEIEGLSIYQASTPHYPLGALTYSMKANSFQGFAVSSLSELLAELGIRPNTAYSPRARSSDGGPSPISGSCSGNGYFTNQQCSCFLGFTGPECNQFACTNSCSGKGRCTGPNQCSCDAGWGGLHCSFLLVEPSYETDANGGDGDDPAIWISPVSPELSRVIMTVKSERGAGLGVFDLQGKQTQAFPAPQPNNVDMIYGFQAGDRRVDLAFAGCRTDNTLCLFEMHPNGTLTDIPGGSQPLPPKYKVYGSCTYLSPKTGKQYLFVNEKSARYLQYELTAAADGTLQTTLVRDFIGGNGGQVEGCVTDEQNGWLFLGEEPVALWRYDAEPNSTAPGHLVAAVGDGGPLNAEVEGVTLVTGKRPDQGYILASNQGVSSFAVYRRAEPHEYVTTFQVVRSADGRVDAVSNTDGITAVGKALGPDFPRGLVVVHDDANELPGGGASEDASFKLISLEKILGAEALKGLNLLDDVDPEWDPRA
ncbi:hypothetical protein RB593_004028 [Gaeumannomyces tritici]